jgi:hypothetical protein
MNTISNKYILLMAQSYINNTKLSFYYYFLYACQYISLKFLMVCGYFLLAIFLFTVWLEKFS